MGTIDHDFANVVAIKQWLNGPIAENIGHDRRDHLLALHTADNEVSIDQRLGKDRLNKLPDLFGVFYVISALDLLDQELLHLFTHGAELRRWIISADILCRCAMMFCWNRRSIGGC